MVAETYSGMVLGVEGSMVKIQADISDGLPVFHMVGLLSSEVKEAKERVRTAFKNIGIRIPPKRIAVNLAPADLKKRGTGFDLGIAVALLVAMGFIEQEDVEGYIFLGEMALDGCLCKVQGALSILHKAQKSGYGRCVIPQENFQEASLLAGLEILSFSSLLEVYQYFSGSYRRREEGEILPYVSQGIIQGEDKPHFSMVDFSEIRGQKLAKRALMIAAAGFHNVYLDGPPGVGKSMLASAVPGILPVMTKEEIIDATMIYSVKGLLDDSFNCVGERPFRNPGHAITKVGLFGGGIDPKPGEISLAHHGVLFLDEFAEYKKEILEMLRLPLEEHKIILVRNERTIIYPSDFLLIAASNPCPCGYYPDRSLCRCSESMIRQYQNRLSGPIMDRMDLFVRCDRVDYKSFLSSKDEEDSASIRKKVMTAWQIQKERFQGKREYFNGRMSPSDIDRYCKLAKEDNKILERAFNSYGMTGRGLNRLLKLARTIADLEEEECILRHHLEEAFLYRRTLSGEIMRWMP